MLAHHGERANEARRGPAVDAYELQPGSPDERIVEGEPEQASKRTSAPQEEELTCESSRVEDETRDRTSGAASDTMDTMDPSSPGAERQVSEPRHKMNTSNLERRGIEARLLVRRREAGALIGKRGANIKRLRQLFKESAFNIPDTGNGPERIVCVNTRSLEQLTQILTELTQLFQEKQLSQSARAAHLGHLSPAYLHEQAAPRASELLEVKLLVNASHAGLLIGVGGQSIRKLRNDSKAAIKIYELCCPLSSERVCAIKAKPPVVVSTIKMILEILAVNPIKGSHKPYDALNFDLMLVDKYGGYAADDDCCSIVPLAPSTHFPIPHSASTSASASVSSSGSASFDALRQLHQADQAFPASSALILQSHAAHLLAAAAAVATGRNGDHSFDQDRHLPTQALRLNRFNRPPMLCDRYGAAAAGIFAVQKYHSIVKANHKAFAASRFHPYYATYDAQPERPHHQHYAALAERHPSRPEAGAARQAANEHRSQSCKSGSQGLTCSCCLKAKCVADTGQCSSAAPAE